MPNVNVKLYTLDSAAPNDPIPSVSVRLYDQTGAQLITDYVSDASGVIETILPTEDAPYTARSFKVGYAWGPPVLLAITEDSEWNLYGEALHDPTSADPRVCVANGYFRDATNQPQSGLDVHFMPVFEPLLLDGNAVLKERTLARTDEDGYLAIPLIRFAKYDVVIEGIDEGVRRINIPDLASCNLPELIFAYVKTVQVDPDPIALTVGGTLELDVTVWDSAGVELEGTAPEDVRWTIEQADTFVSMTVDAEKITLLGLAAGTAKLVPERVDQSIISIPYSPLSDQAVDITVT